MKRHAPQYSELPFTFKDPSPATWLTDYSPHDKPWDVHRGQVDDVGGIYAKALDFERLAERMNACSGFLGFIWVNDLDTGASHLKLSKAQFCRVRYCPVCQWRRSLMWQARFYQALPQLVISYPKARWLFLTLTVRNCDIADLSETLKSMNVAWKRFIDRQELSSISGWLRTTEVTRGKDRSAHPHFHVLLMVSPSWFSHGYIKKSRWVELWKDSLRVNYSPSVDIRTVKPKDEAHSSLDLLRGAVAETLKYSVKPTDMTSDPAWFLELTRQTHKKRFMASGGVLKDILKEDQETDSDLILAGSSTVDGSEFELVTFDWQVQARKYKRRF